MKENNLQLPENTPLTTIAKHAIRVGAEQDFEQWVNTIGKKASTYAGFKGRYLIPPKAGDPLNEYTIAFQFENLKTLTAWMDSNERKEETKKLKEFSTKEVQLEHREGIDFWFVNETNPAKRPPTWKMAILTWIAVFAGVMLLPKLFKFLFPSLAPILITLIVTLTLVALMTWVLMPVITQLFKRWLFK